MKVLEIRVSGKFERQYKKLLKRIKESAVEKEVVFRNNPFDASLNTHKLHGEDRDVWSFSVTHSYRIKFIFITESVVLFLEIGAHSVYK